MAEEKSIINTKVILTVISLILGLFLGVIGLESYIDGRIDKKIEDPNYLNRIATKLRPSIIFDSYGSIIADQGGMEYIDNIQVTRNNEDPKFTAKSIIITPKDFLAQQPLLTSLDQNNYSIIAKRGKKYDWNYNLSLISWTENTSSVFRLEIIR